VFGVFGAEEEVFMMKVECSRIALYKSNSCNISNIPPAYHARACLKVMGVISLTLSYSSHFSR